MKLNNKGFAITAVLYGLLILFVILVSSYLTVLAAKKNRLDEITSEIEKKVVASDYINNLFNKTGIVSEGDGTTVDDIDTTHQLIKDPLGNIRYYGTRISDSSTIYKEPNNYIDIGDNELWRIIGLFKDVELSDGTKKDLIKVMRSSSIGAYSWDISDSSVNQGKGINQWGESDGYEGADLMRLLNPKPDGTSYTGINGSLYWNSQSGTCYSEYNNGTTNCDFRSTGLADAVKSKIAEVKWNLGGGLSSSIYPNAALTMERGTNVVQPGITCSGSYCNDTVTRNATWTGKIALPYLSDYGYATDLSLCSSPLIQYNSSDNSSACKQNNWMFPILATGKAGLLMNTVTSGPSSLYRLYILGQVNNNGSTLNSGHVVPVLYLDSKLLLKGGSGTSSDPYVVW